MKSMHHPNVVKMYEVPVPRKQSRDAVRLGSSQQSCTELGVGYVSHVSHWAVKHFQSEETGNEPNTNPTMSRAVVAVS